MTSVYQAWQSVMADVQAIHKDSRNTQQNYIFRGIDATMNAVGPALRAHGVAVVPTSVAPTWRDVQTTTGKPARECTVTVTYTVHGPEGDSFTIASIGESMDAGDKGAPKAMSVAYRTALLQALCVPTDEPDPDSYAYERAPQQPPPPPADDGTPMSDRTRGALFATLTEAGITDEDDQRKRMSKFLGREVESRSSLTEQEARRIINAVRPKGAPSHE